MSSNSLRVSTDLFEQALQHGQVMSRSAAQQVEHWARIGAAVEASGLAMPQLLALLKGELPAAASNLSTGAFASEAQLRAHKRAQQQRDIASIASGQSSNEAMSWFSSSKARRAKAINSPL